MTPTGRTKDRYHPVPNKAEKAHHRRVMALPCLSCHIEPCGVAHHVMHGPYRRWRRDHRQVVNLCDTCHRSLHGRGSETAWQDERGLDLAIEADTLWAESVYMGVV